MMIQLFESKNNYYNIINNLRMIFEVIQKTTLLCYINFLN